MYQTLLYNLDKEEHETNFAQFKSLHKAESYFLSKKRNPLPFLIEKNHDKMQTVRENENLNTNKKLKEKINFSSSTNLSKESKKNKDNQNKKFIKEKNIFKLCAVNNIVTEEKLKLIHKGKNKSKDFSPRDFLHQIRTKNNFITLNKQFSKDFNIDNVSMYNFISKPRRINQNNNLQKNFFLINKKENQNNKDVFAKNSENTHVSESKEKSFNLSNISLRNVGLSENNLINFCERNDNNILGKTVDLSYSELRKFTYFNSNLFEDSENIFKKYENIKNILKEKINVKNLKDEKKLSLHSKKKNEGVDSLNNENEVFLNNLNSCDKNIENNNDSYNEDSVILYYECIFSQCSQVFEDRKKWEQHYNQHL